MAGKKRAKQNTNPVWLLVGVLLLIAVLVVLMFYRSGVLFGETGTEDLRKQTDQYVFETGTQQVFAPLEGGLAVGSSTGLQILDAEGYTILRSVVTVTTPAIVSGGDTAVVYDVGGTVMRAGNTAGEVTVLDTNNTIISVTMNPSGYLAVVTEETGYKGKVTVYNAEMEPVYAWYSGTNYVLSARVSPDCKTMVALTLEETGSGAHVFSLSSENEYATYSAPGILLFDMEFLSNDHLCAVHDDGLVFFTTAGVEGESYSFEGQYLSGYSFDGDGFVTLMLSQYLSGNAGTVITVGYGGAVTGQLTPEEVPQSVSIQEKKVLIRYGEYAALYSQSLEETNRVTVTQGSKNAVLTDKNKGFMIYSGYCEPLTF